MLEYRSDITAYVILLIWTTIELDCFIYLYNILFMVRNAIHNYIILFMRNKF